MIAETLRQPHSVQGGPGELCDSMRQVVRQVHPVVMPRSWTWIPDADTPLEIADVGKQSRAGGPKSEYRILDALTSRADGVVKSAVAILVGKQN